MSGVAGSGVRNSMTMRSPPVPNGRSIARTPEVPEACSGVRRTSVVAAGVVICWAVSHFWDRSSGAVNPFFSPPPPMGVRLLYPSSVQAVKLPAVHVWRFWWANPRLCPISWTTAALSATAPSWNQLTDPGMPARPHHAPQYFEFRTMEMWS